MKTRALIAAAISVLAVAVVAIASVQSQQGPEAFCTPQTLRGSYAYSIQGHRDGQPYASSGFMAFDGAGRALVLWTSSVERRQRSTTGTYTVSAGCAGQMTLDVTTVNHFYLSPRGDRFSFVRTSGDGVIATEATRVSRELIIKQP